MYSNRGVVGCTSPMYNFSKEKKKESSTGPDGFFRRRSVSIVYHGRCAVISKGWTRAHNLMNRSTTWMDCKLAEQIGQTNGDNHSVGSCGHVSCNAVPVPQLAASVAATQQKVIWLFWAQGWNNAPTIALVCADSWERHNPSWVVRRLSLANLSAFEITSRHSKSDSNGHR